MIRDFTEDVPSPIDLRSMHDAREWAASAMIKRPWREDFCCMLRPALDLGSVIDRSNAAAQTGVGFDSSRDVSLRCFDRCH